MLKLIIEIHLVPEMGLLLQLWTPAMLFHSMRCCESVLHLWELIDILELHTFIFTSIDLPVEILTLLFWEVIASLRMTTALWILPAAIAIGLVQP